MGVGKFIKKTVGKVVGGESEAHRSAEETRAYWQNPEDANNTPDKYVGEKDSQRLRSEYLVGLIQERVEAPGPLFELGCNVGRNLNYLFEAGYTDLSAIEINESAVTILRERFPEMGAAAKIHVGAAEDHIKDMPDGSFELVFTMAVLEHIHEDSEWLFAELARISNGWLICVEDEDSTSWRHFPRNYKTLFEGLGLTQVAELNLDAKAHGLGKAFWARVFKKG